MKEKRRLIVLSPPSWLPLAALPVSLLALALSVWVAVATRRGVRRLTGALSEPELRRALLRATADFGPLADRVASLESDVDGLRGAATRALQTPGVVRFQAFNGDGPALSFSMALLDGRHSGVIITSLHARDQVRLYAKQVVEGKPVQPLSEEEKQSMVLAWDAQPSLPQQQKPSRRDVR